MILAVKSLHIDPELDVRDIDFPEGWLSPLIELESPASTMLRDPFKNLKLKKFQRLPEDYDDDGSVDWAYMEFVEQLSSQGFEAMMTLDTKKLVLEEKFWNTEKENLHVTEFEYREDMIKVKPYFYEQIKKRFPNVKHVEFNVIEGFFSDVRGF